jgi:MFS family permease
MKTILKLEELTLFLLGIFLFAQLPFAWWWFLVLILAPDIGMVGYLFGNKAGAISYNIFHHRGIAVAIYLLGIYLNSDIAQLIGVILFSHAAMDRIFGYGLKYEKGFKFTHLGEL